MNAGAFLNLSISQRGDFLSPADGQPVSFSSNAPDAYPAFKNQLGIGWYGSVGLMYKLRPGLHVLLEPHFKVFPKSISRPDYIVDQRYLTTGLTMGLRKHF